MKTWMLAIGLTCCAVFPAQAQSTGGKTHDTKTHGDPVADFIASDANGDTVLQQSEFRAFVKRRAAAGNAASKWVVRFGAWGRALRTVDYDKDGLVSGDELRRYDAQK